MRHGSYPKLLKASSYIFKRIHKSLSVKNSFNYESINLISFVIYQGLQRKYKVKYIITIHFSGYTTVNKSILS